MDPLIWQGLTGAAVAGAGVAASVWQARRSQRSGDANSSYDQIQEDLAATRLELSAMREERKTDREAAILEREKDRKNAESDRREIDYLINVVNGMEDELGQIYDGVRAGTIPPLPPRETAASTTCEAIDMTSQIDMTTDALRVFIVLASVSAAALIVVLNHPKRHRLSFGHIMTRAGTGLVLLAVAYATIESHVTGVRGAPRLWVLSIGLVWLNLGCVALLRERRKTKQRKGSDG